eukprot:TRINITY_DN31907_c0_g1_i1.p1 TRINITY_DN31907_c0_g1~~TRINITY_DN31907_c0_g1_i1.p1  ORF type:complete len:539 (+),score=77.29 TRINITY_DN31907_c0_g1_i1:38-1618(+)
MEHTNKFPSSYARYSERERARSGVEERVLGLLMRASKGSAPSRTSPPPPEPSSDNSFTASTVAPPSLPARSCGSRFYTSTTNSYNNSVNDNRSFNTKSPAPSPGKPIEPAPNMAKTLAKTWKLSNITSPPAPRGNCIDDDVIEVADSLSPIHDSLQAVKADQFFLETPQCQLCQRPSVDPQQLPCDHWVCSSCIVLNEETSEIFCSSCQIPHSGVARQMRKKLESAAQQARQPRCGRCESRQATVICIDCKTGYCESCTNVVHVGTLKLHDIETLIDSGYCEIHKGQPLDTYDTTTGQLRCKQCTNPNSGPSDNTDSESELENAKDQAKAFISLVQSSARVLQDSLKRINTMQQECHSEIQSSFQTWRETLECREQDMTDRCDDFYNKQRADIEHELGRQLALIGTFNRSVSDINKIIRPEGKTDNEDPNSKPRLHLQELNNLLSSTLHIPPLSKLRMTLTEYPQPWNLLLESDTTELKPEEHLKYTDIKKRRQPPHWSEIRDETISESFTVCNADPEPFEISEML